VAVTLRSVPLLGSLDHAVTAPRPFGRGRVHRLGVPSRRSIGTRFRVATLRCAALDLRAFFHRGVRCVRATLPSRVRSMLPWALDRLVPDAAAQSRRPALLDVSPGGPNRFGVPRPERGGKAGCFGPVWLLAIDGGSSPKGEPSIAGAPAPPEGVASAALHCARRPMECQWIRPERESTASVRRPKAFGCRRHRDASPKRLVRDPAPTPKSGGRWFELLLSILPRLPAYMRRDRSPRAITPGGVAVRAPLTRTPPFRGGRMLRRTHRLRPEGRRAMGEPEAPPGGGPLAARDSGISSKLERRLRARQSSCSPGRPRLDPKTKPLLRSEDRKDRRRSAVGAVGPHIPPLVVIRHEHRSARAEMDRDPSRASPTGVGSASVPSAPKRFRNPDRCDPDGQ
jgi:hypothetical protein